MARQRERYTERTRPTRREVGETGGDAVRTAGWRNPIVMLATAGLAVGLMMTVGLLFIAEPEPPAPTAPGLPAGAEQGLPEGLDLESLPAGDEVGDDAGENGDAEDGDDAASDGGEGAAPQDAEGVGDSEGEDAAAPDAETGGEDGAEGNGDEETAPDEDAASEGEDTGGGDG